MRGVLKRVVQGVAGVVVSFAAVNTAFWLMRREDDLAVIVGLLLLALVGFGWLFVLAVVTSRVVAGKAVVLLVGAALATGCSERVQPGHVGIVVNEYGEDRGVDSYPVQTGRIWYNPVSTSVLQYPYFMQTYELSGDDVIVVNDRDGLRISFPLGVGYTLNRDNVPAFYVKFRTEDVKEFTRGFYKNAAQAAFNAAAARLTAEQIYGAEKQNFVESARATLNEQMKSYGVVTEQFSIIGDMSLPPQVVEAVNLKIQATQRAQQAENELRQTQAEAQKNIAQAEGDSRSKLIRAEADAKANAIIAASLTPTLVQMRQIEKWDGKQPQVVSGASNGLILSLPR